MTHKENLRLQGFMRARKLHSQHKSTAISRRHAKGVAKAFNLPLKQSRVVSPSMEKLGWSPFKYNSCHPEFKGQYKAS